MTDRQQRFNVGRKIGEIARAHPSHPAIIAADITLPYRNYWRIVRSFAQRLVERDIGPGSIVGSLTRDLIASLALQHASALVGAGFVVIEPELSRSGTVHPTHVFRTPDSPETPGFSMELIDGSWPQAAPEDPDADGSEFCGYSAPGQDWYYVHTSGTTGTPKFLALSQKDVYLRSVAAAEADFPYNDNRLCSLFPANTRPLFARANAAMFHAGTLIDTIDVDFLHRHAATIVCASPLTASDWLKGRAISPKLPVIQVSGSRLTPEVTTHLLKSFERVEDVYGASETSKSFVTEHRSENNRLVQIGKPLDSQIELLANDGSVVGKPNISGNLRVKNPYTAKSYIGAPDASAKAFRDGWFYPGDVASWGENGALQVVGRGDHLLNLGGIKINPETIESVLAASLGIRSSAAMILPADLGAPAVLALVTLQDGALPDVAVPAAREACEKALAGTAVPRLIMVVDDLPLTGDGTPKRQDCETLAANLVSSLNVKEVIGHE